MRGSYDNYNSTVSLSLGINIYSIVYTYAIYIDTVRYTDLFPFMSDEPPGFITDLLVVHALLLLLTISSCHLKHYIS